MKLIFISSVLFLPCTFYCAVFCLKRASRIAVKINEGCYGKHMAVFVYLFTPFLPFSKLSIWSLVNEVLFLCSFLFNRSLAWSSSGPTLDPAFELSPEFVSSELTPSRSVTVIRYPD